MIINIPLQLDEANIEKAINEEYQSKVIDELVKRIERILVAEGGQYSYNPKEQGMRNFITQEVGKYLADYKDEIISIAGQELAKKLANSKRGKELLESFDQ